MVRSFKMPAFSILFSTLPRSLKLGSYIHKRLTYNNIMRQTDLMYRYISNTTCYERLVSKTNRIPCIWASTSGGVRDSGAPAARRSARSWRRGRTWSRAAWAGPACPPPPPRRSSSAPRPRTIAGKRSSTYLLSFLFIYLRTFSS